MPDSFIQPTDTGPQTEGGSIVSINQQTSSSSPAATYSIYEMSTKYNDDDGCNIRRVRRSPHLSAQQLYLFFQKIEIVAETGLALDGSGQGSDPQIMVRWSDDGGKTWQNEVWIPMGKIGEFRHRIRKWRLGRSLDRVFEVIFTDPVPIRLIDGFVEYTTGKPSK